MNPVKLRASIYMLLAALPVFITYLTGVVDKISEGKTVLFHWSIWALLSCNAAYQVGITLRAFIDGTAERTRNPGLAANLSMPIAEATIKIALLVSLLAALAGAGCVSTKAPPPASQMESRIQNFTALATAIYVSQNPESRSGLEAAVEALSALDTAGDFDPGAFSNTVNGNQQLYAAVIRFVLNELRVEGITMQTPEEVKRFLGPIRNGIGQGLGSK